MEGGYANEGMKNRDRGRMEKRNVINEREKQKSSSVNERKPKVTGSDNILL